MSADEAIDARRRRRWLDDVLDSLTEEHRAVLVLVDIEEQTMADASDALGIPPGTVASRLRRARELFEAAAQTLKAKLDLAEKEVHAMNGSEFFQVTLKSSKIDAPLSGSKTRALVHVEQALKASTSVANTSQRRPPRMPSRRPSSQDRDAAAACGDRCVALWMAGGYALTARHLAAARNRWPSNPHSNDFEVRSRAFVNNGVALPVAKTDCMTIAAPPDDDSAAIPCNL